MTIAPAPVDQEKLMSLVMQGVNDAGALLSGTLVVIGDKLGLFRAIRDAGPLTSAELARATNTAERYCRAGTRHQYGRTLLP